MILIKEAITKKEMKAYVTFPFSLYKNNPYWVPPIISDEIDSFDKTLNPVFKHAEARYFLAYKNNKIVGRVAAIMNWTEIKEQGIRKMRFGWFDTIDDIQVTKALLEKVKDIGKKNSLEFIEGPVGFSNLDKVGVLIEGFDHIGTMITWYNHPYYKTHLEELGYLKAKEWHENIIQFANINPKDFHKISKIVAKRYRLTSLDIKKVDQVLPYVDKMFDLFNKSYSKLASFVPISNNQIAYFKNKYIKLIDPEFIKFVVDENDELVAFAVTMPSFSKALQKANGKLFPFGIFHLLKAKRQNTEAILYLIGVRPDYQKKGAVSMIMDSYYNTYQEKGITKLIRTPELEDNVSARQLWKNFKPEIHKRRRTYYKNID
jgi:ribosomal protein S18 acetylase RimI-like enzyme|tara:strand:- start:609 stop:1730 length:1122 start_codon:yes stop_codon:yes gene_type:complete